MHCCKLLSNLVNTKCVNCIFYRHTKYFQMCDSQRSTEPHAISLIDEIIDYSERGYANLSHNEQHRISSIISIFKHKKIRSSNPLEMGDLVASLIELLPIRSQIFYEFCDSVANVCIFDREFIKFTDEAIETITKIIISHLELKANDPAPVLRALSIILYGNTLRVVKYHQMIIKIAKDVSTMSDEAKRRACELVGNLTAFSKMKLDLTIYKEALKFLSNALNGSSNDLLISALRALQLLIMDAPKNILEIHILTHLISKFLFRKGPAVIKFEASMALKALVIVSGPQFYPQWQMLLTNDQSLFDLLKLSQKIGKSTADLLTEIFRDTWKYMLIADNVSKSISFTTLAQQIGNIIDICFNRFLDVLKSDKIDEIVYNKVAKAFATFTRNCSFDSGRLKDGYIEQIIEWCKSKIETKTEESLIVLKSLLWTNINYGSFTKEFDFLFNTFVFYLGDKNECIDKPAKFALCRMAFAYPDEVVKRYSAIRAKLKEVTLSSSLPILLKLIEKVDDNMEIWHDLYEYFIPKSFGLNHIKSIQRSLTIIGLSGPIFDKLPDHIQRFFLSTVLSDNYFESYQAVGLLAKSVAADTSSVFLSDALQKLINSNSSQTKALSNVLEAYALRDKNLFQKDWINSILNYLKNDKTPYKPRCIGFLFAFIDPESEIAQNLINELIVFMKSDEPKIRWNSATAFTYSFQYKCFNKEAIKVLINSLDNDPIAKVQIKSADALLKINSRATFADLYIHLLKIVLKLLLTPFYFTNLSLNSQRKYDAKFRNSLTLLFFKLLQWSKSIDFSSLEDILVPNVNEIHNLFCEEENPPWEQITRLYEAKFNSIPTAILEKFQDKAFPI